MRTPEILAPAGSEESLLAALRCGADAVYVGGKLFSARQNAANFDLPQLQHAVELCHLYGAKLYLTVNTLIFESEFPSLVQFLQAAMEMGVNAFLVQDLGVLRLIRRMSPDVPVHASTQMTIHTPEGAHWAKQHGISRVVVSRELSREEIAAVCQTGVEVETFVHGALCYCYSGQCLFSSMLGGRSGNRGRCAQPCRLPYHVEDGREEYPLSMKDMCTIHLIPKLMDAGIDSFKIEGRMKTALYVATVARTYRKAIDDYMESPEKYQANMPWYQEQISNCTYRQFTTGFFYGKPDDTAQIYDSNTYEKDYVYLGITGKADENGVFDLEQKNKFSVGEVIEIMKPDGRNIETVVEGIWDLEGNEQESAPHARQALKVKLRDIPDEMDLLRRSE